LSALSHPGVRDIIAAVLDAPRGFVILSREIPLGEATYMVNASPIREPGREPSGAVAVFRDITALKRMETAKSMFVSMVAHEVKSPLAAAEG
jgi:signal transduction histidine kinase